MARYTGDDGLKRKSLLLVSGFWAVSRHFNYLPELTSIFMVAVPAQFTHFYPYFFTVFLAILLVREGETCPVALLPVRLTSQLAACFYPHRRTVLIVMKCAAPRSTASTGKSTRTASLLCSSLESTENRNIATVVHGFAWQVAARAGAGLIAGCASMYGPLISLH